ncbi:MAG: SDR family oxidoreductase [Chitinophagaceae bacterium]|nr:SDR family oxidoreductase [Chitinophagaceae bacterium]
MRILITGGAGFIGSHIVSALLSHPEVSFVRVLDNLSTGSKTNLQEFEHHPKLEFIEGDIRDFNTCLAACEGIDLITHQAALGSVPRSINDPVTTNDVNITGTLHIFTAAKENSIKRVVYAASSSTYGDHPDLPKQEDKIGQPLSPYAVTKYVNELYAKVFANLYGIETIGLRYFNIFGPRQNPKGPYAAVIPLFAEAIINHTPPTINGDGLHSRDFTFVENAVQANLLALFTDNKEAVNQVYNIACGDVTTLNELFEYLLQASGQSLQPIHGQERSGDVKHSLADISKAQKLLNYQVLVPVKEGLQKTYAWYQQQEKSKNKVN